MSSTTEPTQEPTASGGGVGWKVATALLGVTTIGLGAWAVSLNNQVSDLQAENEALSASTVDTADRLGTTRQNLRASVLALGVTDEQLRVTEDQVAQAAAALEEAQGALNAAAGDIEQAQAQAQVSAAQAENAALCATGALSAWIQYLDADEEEAGLEAAESTLNQVAEACRAAGLA